MSAEILEAAAALAHQGKRCAIVTIIETVGSTPRKAGAKMLVREDGSIMGTIGGGCVEADLIAFAVLSLRSGKMSIREIDLSLKSADENDMLCGGRMKALIEPVKTEEQLFIFGGGHISQALAGICTKLDFQVTVTDDREQFANPERFPDVGRTLALPFEKQFAELRIMPGSYVVIATRGHSHDQLCMEEALRTQARYIAMIGSRTKYAVFRNNLREKGFTDEQLDRVKCPAGMAIGAETPEEIAVSIAAQLIQSRRQA